MNLGLWSLSEYAAGSRVIAGNLLALMIYRAKRNSSLTASLDECSPGFLGGDSTAGEPSFQKESMRVVPSLGKPSPSNVLRPGKRTSLAMGDF